MVSGFTNFRRFRSSQRKSILHILANIPIQAAPWRSSQPEQHGFARQQSRELIFSSAAPLPALPPFHPSLLIRHQKSTIFVEGVSRVSCCEGGCSGIADSEGRGDDRSWAHPKFSRAGCAVERGGHEGFFPLRFRVPFLSDAGWAVDFFFAGCLGLSAALSSASICSTVGKADSRFFGSIRVNS